MPSIEKQPVEDSMHRYGNEAVKLVTDGYRRMNQALETAIKVRGDFSQGTILKEAVHQKYPLPPLLTAEGYIQFRQAEDLFTAEDVLGAIWAILESNCGETGLLPAITVEREHGRVIVELH